MLKDLYIRLFVTPYENGKLKSHMYHYTYDNWEQYTSKLNKYTTLAAEKYKDEGKNINFFYRCRFKTVVGIF